MAGDWIKVEHTLPDKPEVVRLSELLGIDQDAVVGKLVRFWVWTDQQSVDGDAISVTPAFIDRLTNCPGFTVRLLEVGWLTSRNGRFSIPNFDRHNGQTAKARALTSNRVKRSRNAASVTSALPEKRREEKRRGGRNPPPVVPPEFETFWVAYPKKVGKQDAIRAWLKLSPSGEFLLKMLSAIEKQKRSQQWQDAQYIPNPATWLNQARWDDELPEAPSRKTGPDLFGGIRAFLENSSDVPGVFGGDGVPGGGNRKAGFGGNGPGLLRPPG